MKVGHAWIQGGKFSDSTGRTVLGRSFVKRFALCYLSVYHVLSVLSVTLVYCGQTVGSIKMPLGTEVGLGPGHIVLYGYPAHQKKEHSSPQFSAYVYCGQAAGWIKMPLRKEVGLGPGHTVLVADPSSHTQRGTAVPPLFRPCL